jgi:hypothetical protein
MSLPNGLRAIAVSLKCCIPKGIPIIVIHSKTPKNACEMAIHRPPVRSQMIFMII